MSSTVPDINRSLSVTKRIVSAGTGSERLGGTDGKGGSDRKGTSPDIVRNPFENTQFKSYSHQAQIVPPYVLDRLSEAHYKDQLNNTNTNVAPTTTGSNQATKIQHGKRDEEEQFTSFANDPFVKSLNNDWHTLLHSVEQTYTGPGAVTLDNSYNTEWKLDGSWGGEDRLKQALVGHSSSDEDSFLSSDRGMLRSLLGLCGLRAKSSSSSNKKIDYDRPKVRSKAGYWMSDEKKADVLPVLNRIFVQNPLVPLFLRILIIIFSTCALALACVIYRYSRRKYDGVSIQQEPSTIMAIVVQCCAIVYVIYIAYDEYSGKPLGLRNPLGKMKLIMLDLLFIIFSSANLSLTFNTLYDNEWVCQSDDNPALANIGIHYPKVFSICSRQRALASFLFLVLCLWVLTFTISITRVVDRVNTSVPR